MRLPLTLTPRPSRLLFVMLLAGHLVAAAALGATAIPLWGIAVSWLLIVASLGHFLPRLWLSGPIRIVLRDDGRMEIEWTTGQRQEERVGKDTVVLSWLIVLACENADRRRFLPLPGDTLDAESQRLLRLWLRWRTQPEKPDTP